MVLGGIAILLTSVWIKMTSGKAYVAILATRVTAQAIMLPIQVVVIFVLEKFLRPFFKKYLYN